MLENAWHLLASRTLSEHVIFRLDEDRYRLEPGGSECGFVRLVCPDWVNVVPLTPEGQVVLIRQYRQGVRSVTLEIPGGIIDPGESPEAAAVRELHEETGYAAERIVHLGDVWPNPAVATNTCHFYLAENVRPEAAPSPDLFERIEVVLTPLERIPELVRTGQIRHGLVLNALAMSGVPMRTV